MPTISSKKLSKEKLQELKRYVCMEYYSAAVQACIDTLGPEDTTKMFQPYDKLSGHAIVINLEAKNRFPYTMNDLLRAAIQIYYIIPLMWMAKISNGFMTANSFSADVTHCIGQNLPEVCEDCNIMGQAQIETVNPAFLLNCDMGFRKGLDRCQITIRKKGGNVEPIEEVTTCLLPVRATDEEIDFWPIHYLSGYVFYATNILADSLGEEKVKEILGLYMENAGATVALKLKKELGIVEKDAKGIGAIIEYNNEIYLKTGELTLFTPEIVRKTITRCDFVDPWICYLETKMANGICRVINSDYEFKYESMMSRGDSHCQWVVSKK